VERRVTTGKKRGKKRGSKQKFFWGAFEVLGQEQKHMETRVKKTNTRQKRRGDNSRGPKRRVKFPRGPTYSLNFWGGGNIERVVNGGTAKGGCGWGGKENTYNGGERC